MLKNASSVFCAQTFVANSAVARVIVATSRFATSALPVLRFRVTRIIELGEVLFRRFTSEFLRSIGKVD